MTWSDRRVFVTGATGIVGAWLARRLLAEGAQVVALVRDWDPQSDLIRSGDINRVTAVHGCLEDAAALERAISCHGIDAVFHLGAQAIVTTAMRSPLATFETNIRGTYNVLEACRVHRALVSSVVVASSDKAYGQAATLPYREDMPLEGRHPYDVSKSCADLIALSYAAAYDLPVAVARCGNVYGGGDLHWSRIVPGTIRSLWRGEAPVIRSDGRFTRDYIYVEDVVNGYLQLAGRVAEPGVRGEAFNFGPGVPTSVLDITGRLQRLMDREDLTPVVLDCAAGEIRDQYLDAGKARARLHWSPAWTLDSGLVETIRWYRQFFESSGAVAPLGTMSDR